jgi:predicted nucleotidyltransferase/DNA-binding XRE family transcriptional regulator
MVQKSSEILRNARLTAQLTQSELASRAQLTQSVVSAYESGRREPALSTLVKLVEATGFVINIGLTHPLLHTPDFMGLVHRNKQQILALAHAAGVSNMRVFGSVARGTAGPTSDIDLLVDISPDVGLIALMQLEKDIQELLGVEIDLVPESGLKPGIRDQVLREAISL